MNKGIALITGASSGIGKEFAIQLHAKGYDVTLLARRAEFLQELESKLNSMRANSARSLVIDLASEDAENGLPAAEKYLQDNPVTLLVNNAGRGSFGYFDSLEVSTELQLVKLNVEASLRLAHAALPAMKRNKQGGIISVSSIAGFQPIPFMATYAATKAFNLIHSLGLWYELKPFNVKVTVVCPGPVATEFGGVARVPGMVTGTSRDSVEPVVAESIRAFERNKVIVVPCWKPKILAALSRLLPTTLTTWVTGRMLAPVLKASSKVQK